MKTYKIPTTMTVTSEDIDDLLACAFEGGSNDWLKQLRMAEDSPEMDGELFKSETLTRGGILECYDAEEDSWHRLTLQDILDALSKECFNFEDYDGYDADRIVQTAIFGEVIYG